MCIRRSRHDPIRFERSQEHVHREGGIEVWSYVTCHGLGPLVIYDGRLVSSTYIYIYILTYSKNIYQQ